MGIEAIARVSIRNQSHCMKWISDTRIRSNRDDIGNSAISARGIQLEFLATKMVSFAVCEFLRETIPPTINPSTQSEDKKRKSQEGILNSMHVRRSMLATNSS